ncbi:MAG TPA: DUF2922 domain-containing protein [Desulfotomaculum sp.]|nr:DUF2922 domain-containing protein [Desulfotomaculum sp.]
MAVTTAQTLRMVFRNEAGSNFTLSLDNPRDDLTAAEIEAAMDSIITKNIFLTTGGPLVAKQDIKIIDRTTDDMYDPA